MSDEEVKPISIRGFNFDWTFRGTSYEDIVSQCQATYERSVGGPEAVKQSGIEFDFSMNPYLTTSGGAVKVWEGRFKGTVVLNVKEFEESRKIQVTPQEQFVQSRGIGAPGPSRAQRRKKP